MAIDILGLFSLTGIYLLGIITSTFFKVINNELFKPYYKWNEKKDIKNENVDAVKSLIVEFCSSWDLFKCRSIPYINLEKEMVIICRDIHSIVSKNESNFQKNDIGESMKGVCKKFIALHPQTDGGSGWLQGAEKQIDELCIEIEIYKKML